MKKAYLVILTTLVMTLVATTFVYAAVPHTIRFQGKVTDKAGSPLNGSYNITFRLYESETGGSPIWTEPQTNVAVNNGIFTALLGKVTPLDLPFSDAYWLSIAVGGDDEMTPRQALTTVGYAIHAETAERLLESSVVPSGAIILWTGASCPEGYTRFAALDGKFIQANATYNANAGGNDTHTHTTTVDSTGSHYHDAGGLTTTAVGGNYTDLGTAFTAAPNHSHNVTGNTGNAGIHTHSVTVGAGDSRPPFATIIFCKKD